MDFYLVDLEYLSFLKERRSDIHTRVSHLLDNIQTGTIHSVGPENLSSPYTKYTIGNRGFETYQEYFRISEKILSFVLDNKIKRIFFCSHCVYPFLLLHDLYNLGVEVHILQQENNTAISPDQFSVALGPLLLDHAQDFILNFPSVKNGLFFSLILELTQFEARELIKDPKGEPSGEDEYLVVSLLEEPVRAIVKGIIHNEADVLVFTQRFQDQSKHYSCSVNSRQDFSFLVYQPLVGAKCSFVVSRKFFTGLTNEEKILLFEDPNWLFYKKGALVVSTMLKTNADKHLEPLEFESGVDFERMYFHRSRALSLKVKTLHKEISWK